MKARPHRLGAALYALTLISAVAPAFGPAFDRANAEEPKLSSPAPSLALNWDVTGVTPDPKTHHPVTHARFTLRNTGKTPLAPGWTLWFTAIGDSATANPDFPVHRVVGSLFNLVSPSTMAALAPGQSITFALDHPGGILRDDKGPTSPYLTLAQSPEKAWPIASFAKTGPRPAVAGVPASQFTDPAAVWQANLAWQAVSADSIPPALPAPKAWRVTAGQGFLASIGAPELGGGLKPDAVLMQGLALQGTGPRLPFTVDLGPVAGESSPEAYRLTISRAHGVHLTGAGPAGAYYGLRTLEQLIAKARREGGLLHEMEITDAPRFEHRGLLIDVARNFRKADEIRHVIDLMAVLKLNKLHLHLTDDEGWRLEIPALPELTYVGARRGHAATWTNYLPPAVGSGPDLADSQGSGFYTGADYVGILQYAQTRHIEVIPEIDMPGHARAAIKAMEARSAAHPDEHGCYRLIDLADGSRYVSAQGYSDNAIDPTLPSSLRFVETVIDELVRLHQQAGVPLKRMHIGGDEVPAGAWAGRTATKAQLWDSFFAQVLTMLDQRGIAASGWEELGMVSGEAQIRVNPRFSGRNITVQVWNSFEGAEGLGNRFASADYKVILSPAGDLYLDMAQAKDPQEPGHDWVRPLPLDTVLAYDPEAVLPGAPALAPTARANLLGIEATLFSETVRAPWRLDYMLMPRLLAVAERAWSPRPDWSQEPDPARRANQQQVEWARFSLQLGERVLPFIDRRFPKLGYRLPAPGAIIRDDMLLANYAWPGMTMHYTRDGTAPTAQSPIMRGPIKAGGKVRIIAVSADGRSSPDIEIDSTP